MPGALASHFLFVHRFRGENESRSKDVGIN